MTINGTDFRIQEPSLYSMDLIFAITLGYKSLNEHLCEFMGRFIANYGLTLNYFNEKRVCVDKVTSQSLLVEATGISAVLSYIMCKLMRVYVTVIFEQDIKPVTNV